VSYEHHIKVIIDDLFKEYDPFVTYIIFCIDSYFVEDIKALLLAQEEMFERHKNFEQNPIQANTITPS